MRNWRPTTAVLAAIPLLATACDAQAQGEEGDLSADLTGAGATFPDPLFQDWQYEYTFEQPGVHINYQGIGSGGGIEQFLQETVDFGSSERYLDDDELEEARQQRGCEAIQFPVVFGSVVPAVADADLEGIVLDAETIAGIFDREITTYDDDAIAELNPDMDLPDEEIVPVHRSDSSGTTYVFSHYLSHEVESWEEDYGEGTEIDWAEGAVGGQGNEGVAGGVLQNDGGFGYLNQSYIQEEEDLYPVSVINADGAEVAPTLEATTAASEEAEIPEDYRFDIDDVGGEGFPIAGTNWILAYECGYEEETAEALRDYWTWVTQSDEADELAADLGYAPMGEELKERVADEIERINADDE